MSDDRKQLANYEEHKAMLIKILQETKPEDRKAKIQEMKKYGIQGEFLMEILEGLKNENI